MECGDALLGLVTLAAVTCRVVGTFLGRNQGQVVAAGRSCAGRRGGGCAGARIGDRGRRACGAGAPVAVLLAHFFGGSGQRHGLGVLTGRYAQHGASLQRIDVVVIERIRIGLLERHQHLVDVDAIGRGLVRDGGKRVASLDRAERATRGNARCGSGLGRLRHGGRDRRGGRCALAAGGSGRRSAARGLGGGLHGRLRRRHVGGLAAGRIEQDGEFAQALAGGVVHFDQQVEIGVVDRGCTGDANDLVAIGAIDHGKLQRNRRPGRHACLGGVSSRGELRSEILQLRRTGRVDGDLGQQRLPQRRFDLDLAKLHGRRLGAAQGKRHQHRQLQRTIHRVFPRTTP